MGSSTTDWSAGDLIPASADSDAGATGGERSYGSGARILSIGIAATGIFTFAYFGVAGHVLDSDDYGRVSLLWSLLFVIIELITGRSSNCSPARSPTAARA